MGDFCLRVVILRDEDEVEVLEEKRLEVSMAGVGKIQTRRSVTNAWLAWRRSSLGYRQSVKFR